MANPKYNAKMVVVNASGYFTTDVSVTHHSRDTALRLSVATLEPGVATESKAITTEKNVPDYWDVEFKIDGTSSSWRGKQCNMPNSDDRTAVITLNHGFFQVVTPDTSPCREHF